MTSRELRRRLIATGWEIKQGGKHTLAVNPKLPGVQLTIPRGSGDIDAGTLNKILKDAGLK
ncbi:MAG: type II toxin-antitoxin system HicA family toxin [Symbiobacteriaceae bacterium]|nr:type II toxin-antitoxin system HicA family toxin [Symbiobacteriaceae bacterium]